MRVAGHGTDHLGTGRCKFHGGASPGGLPGNQNAVTHGLTRRPLLQLTGRAQEILDELQAQVAEESPRDPGPLCRRLREVELALAAELAELAERREKVIKRKWDEERYVQLRERWLKRMAAAQSTLSGLLARFPHLSGEDARNDPTDIREVRAILLGFARSLGVGTDAAGAPGPTVPDPPPKA
jgi:hypothetical protein